MKALLFAIAALVFGILAVVACDRLFPSEMSFRTISVLGEAFRTFVLGSFRFALGAFAGLTLDVEGEIGNALGWASRETPSVE